MELSTTLTRRIQLVFDVQSLPPPPSLSSLVCSSTTPSACVALFVCARAVARNGTERNTKKRPRKQKNSWKLIYSSANCGNKAKGGGGSSSKDRLTSIEDISYVSENYRLSHSDDSVLRVYRRVDAPARAAATAAAAAAGDDTMAAGASAEGGKKKAGRAAAAAAATGSGVRLAKQPLRKRMFFGFLRR